MCLDYHRKCISNFLIIITSVCSDRIFQLKTLFSFFIIFIEGFLYSQPRHGYSKKTVPSFSLDTKVKIPTAFFLRISKYLLARNFNYLDSDQI